MMDDDFHSEDKDKLELFRANRSEIEQAAEWKYLAGRAEPDGWVLIRTGDEEHAR
jgi:hypothetical protein